MIARESLSKPCRFLQRHEYISCPAESKLLLVELQSQEMMELAATTGKFGFMWGSEVGFSVMDLT